MTKHSIISNSMFLLKDKIVLRADCFFKTDFSKFTKPTKAGLNLLKF